MITHAARARSSQRPRKIVANGEARVLILPTPRPCSFVPSVTTPLYSTTVSQPLRQTLRGEVPKGYPPAPATTRTLGGTEDMEREDTSYLTRFSIDGEYNSNTFSEPRGRLLRASATL